MGTKRHHYTVELRLWGETLDPDVITQETGLQPCQTRRAGQPLGTRTTYSENMWAFNGESDEYGTKWESLEEGLTFVLNGLGQAAEHSVEYRREYRAIWWCGLFQNSSTAGLCCRDTSSKDWQRLESTCSSITTSNKMVRPIRVNVRSLSRYSRNPQLCLLSFTGHIWSIEEIVGLLGERP
jgi:hypothetical protein